MGDGVEEAVDVTSDGGVTKVVLKEGTGPVVPRHARCLGEPARGLCLCCYVSCTRVHTQTQPRRRRPPWAPHSAHPPPPAAVHFVGRLAEGGEVFMDTRSESGTEEPVTRVAGRGDCR